MSKHSIIVDIVIETFLYFSYNRAKIHWSVFRKVLSDDLGVLVDSGDWTTVLEYVLSAWEVVSMTPVWDNPVHNVTRIACFKHLGEYE